MNLNYTHYTSEEFAEDKVFWLWVLEKDTAQEAFWKSFMKEHPEKAGEIERARQMVLQLNRANHKLEEKKVESLWQRIHESKERLDAAANPVPASEYNKASC
jgi:hypothetical protein